MAANGIQGLAVKLIFDASVQRPPLEFELELGEKEVISVGRAPKSDVVCTLSGISWHHLELRLADPDTWEGSLPHLVLRDLSMNGTGMRLPDESAAQKMTKDGEKRVPDGAAVSFPMRKPKAKGKEDTRDVIQQTFTVGIEPLLQGGGQQKPTEPAVQSGAAVSQQTQQPQQPALKKAGQADTKQAEESEDGSPKKRRVNLAGDGQADPLLAAAEAAAAKANTSLPENGARRLAKGEALVRSARHAESRGRLAEAFDAYRRGLQHIIRVLPLFEKDSPQVGPTQTMVKENLDRAAMVKQRQSRLKLAEIELP